jgi:hypothetical protein
MGYWRTTGVYVRKAANSDESATILEPVQDYSNFSLASVLGDSKVLVPKVITRMTSAEGRKQNAPKDCATGRCFPKASRLFSWFPGEKVSPAHAVLPGRAFFRGPTKAVEVGRYVYVLKSQVAQERD